MLEELAIRGLGVIEDATLRLAPGLTVVTGETGAGKTMVVTALELLLGARADANLIRAGADAAVVSAVVRPAPAEAAEWMDGEAEDGAELVVAREVRANGRGRARIAGQLVPIGALTDLLGSHVEVHAQHEHVRLARPAVQRRLLDRAAGAPHSRVLSGYHEAYRALQELEERRATAQADARERARELDRLRGELAEIDDAELDPDTDGTIDRDLEILANAEELQVATATAATAVGAEGAGEPLGIAVATLRRLAVDDAALAGLVERAAGLAAEATELAVDLRGYGDAIDADPARLAKLQERKATVQSLTRKYGVDIEAVLAYAEEARERLASLEAIEAEADDLDARIAAAHSELARLSVELRRGRRHAAEVLTRTVDGHLADLAMPHASFTVAVEPLADGGLAAHGGDEVTFLLAPNPGEPALPLGLAASGGERSRVSLAVEVALADVDDASVLAFDEVDAGVGGTTAMAIGEKLARLAIGVDGRPRQVLCVTHLAQLAAFADVHHVVEKGLRDGRTVTTARRVADEDRVVELSRMLGGDATAKAGIEHAQVLLETAQQRRAS